MYVHPAAAARAACSRLKRVVARVAMPRVSRAWQASMPSHVLGILMQILDEGKVGRMWEYRETIPVCVRI